MKNKFTTRQSMVKSDGVRLFGMLVSDTVKLIVKV